MDWHEQELHVEAPLPADLQAVLDLLGKKGGWGVELWKALRSDMLPCSATVVKHAARGPLS